MWQAGASAWNDGSFAPTPDSDWNAYNARLMRYRMGWAYYNNTVYSNLDRYSALKKVNSSLYKHTRGVINPVARFADLRTSKVYGGSLDMETGTRGAIPIAQADDALLEAILQVWKWSVWGTQKTTYVRTGEINGDVFIKVVDDVAAQKVRMEVLAPEKVKYLEKDEVGNIKRIVIEYEVDALIAPEPGKPPPAKKTYLYTEEITKDEFTTRKDGELFGFFEDASGNLVSQWANPYGFVPVVHATPKDIGLIFGVTAYHAEVRKIDEINDAASMLNDQIRKIIQPIWYFAGVAKSADLTPKTANPEPSTGKENRDQMPAIYGPEGSQPFPMIAPIDIAAARGNIDSLIAELERSLPELALHHIRDGGNLTAPGVKAAYSDAVERIIESRANYDDALVRAQQMAVSIGGFRGYDGFAGFDLNSYARGDLAHFIADRPVIEESMTVQERIQFLMTSGAPEKAVWAELGIPEQTIKEWEVQKQQKALLAMMAQQNALSSGQQPPQLTAGNTVDATAQPATPTVKGEPLPDHQATNDQPITEADIKKWNAMFEAMSKGLSGA